MSSPRIHARPDLLNLSRELASPSGGARAGVSGSARRLISHTFERRPPIAPTPFDEYDEVDYTGQAPSSTS